jgi:hypothetical protein
VTVDEARLNETERQVLVLGATTHELQPGGYWGIYVDPVGHPFCLCWDQEHAHRGGRGSNSGPDTTGLRPSARRPITSSPKIGPSHPYRRLEARSPGGRPRVLPAGEAVPEEIEVTRVASGLVDHVDEDPAEVGRADPERGNRCDVVE